MFSNTPAASTPRPHNTFFTSSSSSSGDNSSVGDFRSTDYSRLRRVTRASAKNRDPNAIPLNRTRDEEYVSARVEREILSPPSEEHDDPILSKNEGAFRKYRGTPVLQHLERDIDRYTETPIGMYIIYVNYLDELQ